MTSLAVEPGWLVYPATDGVQDLLSFDGVTVGSIIWLRPLRYPSLSRGRMTDGLNGRRSLHGSRHSWSAQRFGDESVYLILHNGVEMGELRWFHGVDRGVHGLLAGLNMQCGRRPVACEPMPLEAPHLKLVR